MPSGKAVINLENNSWEAHDCKIGGKAGDRRILSAYVVGPAGKVLLDYFISAVDEHKKLFEAYKKATNEIPPEEGRYLPVIECATPDMFECDNVTVKRS